MNVVCIGGAPRTGTSLLQAVICSSSNTAKFKGELSFLLQPMFQIAVQAYVQMGNKGHASNYFSDLNALSEWYSNYFHNSLSGLETEADKGLIKVIKDPIVTTNFPLVASLVSDVRFLISVRDPIQALNSFLVVLKKLGREGEDRDREVLKYLRQFQRNYSFDQSENLQYIKHEDIMSSDSQDFIKRYCGLSDLFTRPLWGNVEFDRQGPWITDKYHSQDVLIEEPRPISDVKYSKPLLEFCGHAARRFNYTLNGRL